MKKIIVPVIFLMTLVSCKVCFETKSSFNNALKHKTLTPITVNELKEKIQNSTTDYTITVIYDVCNASSKYIHEVVLPYYNQQANKENISLIFVQKDCSSLSDIEPFFERYGLTQTKYYIRDATPAFSRLKENDEYNANRLNNIIEYIYPNATGKIDSSNMCPICLISDKTGNLKLVEYIYKDSEGKTFKSIRPCPVQYTESDIRNINFLQISQTIVKTPNDEKYFFYWFAPNK